MTLREYNWKRFLIPLGEDVQLNYEGYLEDPEEKWGKYSNPNIVSFDEIENEPCLIILGEPGVGKTTTLQNEQKRLQELGKKVLWVDFKDISSELSLNEEIFDKQEIKELSENSEELYLFLDGLDEALISFNTLANRLIKKLEKLPKNKFFIRLSCRSTVFPSFLKDGLEALWNTKDKAFEIACLRKKDVAQAAQADGIYDTNDFFQKIEEYKISAFAIKPITLNTIIDLYKKQKLTNNQKVIYYNLCEKLCEEINSYRIQQSKITSEYKGNLSSTERLYLAGRVATCLIFNNKSAIFYGEKDKTPEMAINFEKLCKGNELIEGKQIELTHDNLLEVLNTSLFSPHKHGCISFWHKAYSEFLTAWYLLEKQIKSDNLINMITFPESGNEVIPQLYETASWLAGMNKEIFDKICCYDPEVLITSNVINFEDKQKLVDKLFKRAENRKFSLDYFKFNTLSKLKYEGLSEQVKKYIISDNNLVKSLAIDIAEVCKLKDLQTEIYYIAINKKEFLYTRKQALYALTDLADQEVRKDLAVKYEEFLEEFEQNDEEDELKGAYLKVIWPKWISAEKVFNDLLKKPKNDSLIGAYSYFINHELIEGLNFRPNTDIPIALNWIKNFEREKPNNSYRIKELLSNIYLKAWEYIESPIILKMFAETIVERQQKDYTLYFRHYDDNNFYKTVIKDKNKRQTLIKTILLELEIEEEPLKGFIRCSDLIRSVDIPFIIKLFDESEENKKDRIKRVIIEYLSPYFVWNNTSTYDDIDEINELFSQKPYLRESFSIFVNPAQFDDKFEPKDEIFIGQKEYYDKYEKNKEQKDKEGITVEKINLNIESSLNKIEKGEIEYFWTLMQNLRLTPGDTHYHNPKIKVSENPYWEKIDANTKKRILNAALKFLQESNSNEFEKYLNTNHFIHIWYAIGYIPLLIENNISEEILKKILTRWIGIILIIPNFGENYQEIKLALTKLSYNLIPDKTTETLLEIIEIDNGDKKSDILSNFESCWDSNLSEKLFNYAKKSESSSDYKIYIIKNLVINDYLPAKNYAKKLLQEEISRAGEQDENLIVSISEILAFHTADASWDLLWSIIQNKVELKKHILANICHRQRYGGKNIVRKLSEEQLTELYIWMKNNYPDIKRPKSGAYNVTPEISLLDFRENIYNYFINNGLINAFDKIKKANPFKTKEEEESFNYNYLKARRNYYKLNWRPISLNNIVELISDNEKRFIKDASQLLSLVIEKLYLIEQKLQGQTAAVYRLWNSPTNGHQKIYTPKDENELSDEIKRCLEEELINKNIIISREPEIRKGEELDIRIDLLTDTGKDTLIIEVKGCWHPELKTAMETQLLNRYMTNNNCNYGIYLVGWFYCAEWSDIDYRKKKSYSHFKTIQETKKFLKEQSTTLSTKNKVIKNFVINAQIPQ